MRIAVIGCGPRAVALAAKSAGLHSIGEASPSVTIYEQNEAFSAWTGSAGFSNGRSLLCTPIERDVGYPYAGARKLEEYMLSQFSWRSYLTHVGASSFGDLNEWFSRGRPQPDHKEFATYLRWVLDRARASFSGISLKEKCCVEKISYSSNEGWCAEFRQSDNAAFGKEYYDGIVLTGTKPRTDALVSGDSPLYFNGLDFWDKCNIEKILTRATEKFQRESDVSFDIAIAGDGGTSAAIAEFLLSSGPENVAITIVGSRPFLDSRPPNFFSDRLFGDNDSWSQLPFAARNEFLQRTSSGRVWQQVAEVLERSPRFSHKCARVKKGEFVSLSGTDGFYRVHFSMDDYRPGFLTSDVLIDARGFDPLSFLPILEKGLRDCLIPFPSLAGRQVDYIRKSLDDSFCPNLDGVPDGLHLPLLGGLVNPAAGNLMALGCVADAIISKYR
jgi:mycobactin lysine-N-oxygenase